MIFLIWESLGVPKNNNLLESFRNEIKPAQVQILKYEGGSTISAEIRFLCGYDHGLTDTSLRAPKFYSSTAYHGNKLTFFNRKLLYEKMRFSSFLDRYKMSHLPVCHFAYNAVCDRSMLKFIFSKVLSNGCKGITHLLTIDSYFPCLNCKHHAQDLLADLNWFLDEFSEVKKLISECDLVVVGDHPPPLAKGFRAHEILMEKF